MNIGNEETTPNSAVFHKSNVHYLQRRQERNDGFALDDKDMCV